MATLTISAPDLEQMTKAQMLEYAESLGLQGLSSRTKAEIKEAIEAVI